MTLSGFYNGVNNDANANYNGNDYNKAKNNIDDFYNLLPKNSIQLIKCSVLMMQTSTLKVGMALINGTRI